MLQVTPPIKRYNYAKELKKQDTKLKRLLHILRENQNDPEYLSDTLNAMMEYASRHFKAEEDMMKALDYPGYTRHKKQHKNFLETIAQSCLDIVEKKGDPTERVIELLEFWIEKHFAEEDSQLDRFISRAKYLS